MKYIVRLFVRNDQESRTNSQTGNRNSTVVRRVIDSSNTTRGMSFEIVDWWDRPKFFNKTSPRDGLKFQFQVGCVFFSRIRYVKFIDTY